MDGSRTIRYAKVPSTTTEDQEETKQKSSIANLKKIALSMVVYVTIFALGGLSVHIIYTKILPESSSIISDPTSSPSLVSSASTAWGTDASPATSHSSSLSSYSPSHSPSLSSPSPSLSPHLDFASTTEHMEHSTTEPPLIRKWGVVYMYSAPPGSPVDAEALITVQAVCMLYPSIPIELWIHKEMIQPFLRANNSLTVRHLSHPWTLMDDHIWKVEALANSSFEIPIFFDLDVFYRQGWIGFVDDMINQHPADIYWTQAPSPFGGTKNNAQYYFSDELVQKEESLFIEEYKLWPEANSGTIFAVRRSPLIIYFLTLALNIHWKMVGNFRVTKNGRPDQPAFREASYILRNDLRFYWVPHEYWRRKKHHRIECSSQTGEFLYHNGGRAVARCWSALLMEEKAGNVASEPLIIQHSEIGKSCEYFYLQIPHTESRSVYDAIKRNGILSSRICTSESLQPVSEVEEQGQAAKLIVNIRNPFERFRSQFLYSYKDFRQSKRAGKLKSSHRDINDLAANISDRNRNFKMTYEYFLPMEYFLRHRKDIRIICVYEGGPDLSTQMGIILRMKLQHFPMHEIVSAEGDRNRSDELSEEMRTKLANGFLLRDIRLWELSGCADLERRSSEYSTLSPEVLELVPD